MSDQSSVISRDDISPGMLCGIALERVGTRLLRGSKMAILLGKLIAYKRLLNDRDTSLVIKLARKRLGVRGLGVIVQECVDLLR